MHVWTVSTFGFMIRCAEVGCLGGSWMRLERWERLRRCVWMTAVCTGASCNKVVCWRWSGAYSDGVDM